MKRFWIYRPGFDLAFIISPPFIVLILIFLFQDKIQYWQENYSFFTWLILIVFIDVAHVYATLYKTYFNPQQSVLFNKELIYVPLLCFGISFLLYNLGYQIFWSVLAYVAVFHFVRQQYGFMRLYAKKEVEVVKWIDNLVIYNATIYPMVYWFFSPKRNFTWFVENEFLGFPNLLIIKVATLIYVSIVFSYLFWVIFRLIKTKEINLPKILLMTGTYFSWYFGIVYFNNDLIFTLLNVISHGIPYIALIYIDQHKATHLGVLPRLYTLKGLVVFVLILLVFALSEEFFWEVLVWNEQISIFDNSEAIEQWQWIIVPTLMVPQFTHYILDGLIWKKKKI